MRKDLIMKFHGREGGCGSELEYHDSLHLPLLNRLFCCLENNQLGNVASPRDDYLVSPPFSRNQFSVEIY